MTKRKHVSPEALDASLNPFFSSSHLQKVDFPEAGMPEIRKCMS
jgi:hypothetical protein